MATLILMSAVGYLVLSGLLLIALMQSAARTSDDWLASMMSVNRRLAEANPDSDRVIG